MSENLKSVPTDDPIVVDETQRVVDWKLLGKKVAIFGSLFAGGLLVGYVLASPATEELDEETTTDEDTPETI